MKSSTQLNIILTVFLFLFLASPSWPHSKESKGIIKGTLVDADTKSPLIGANVIIINSLLGATTNSEGNFTIFNVPVGNYSIQFQYVGYESVIKTDIIVRPERITSVPAELHVSLLKSEEIVVTGSYFTPAAEQPVSVTNFSREEIRRAPGSAGDVSRIIMGLPSIAKVDDQSNGLVVRGGNPIENTFFIDNIEIPNINHFPDQGSSGGPIGIINVDFIQDVDLYAGGFPALYGDRLSSVMHLSFREGNSNVYEGQIDLNFAGFGGIVEGPIGGENATFMLSARRSYLDFLIGMIDVGSSVAPSYGDIQGKLTYDPDKNNKITLLSIFADDHMKSDKENAVENKMAYFGTQDIYQNTMGINWRLLWGETGFTNTAISWSSTKYIEDFFETGSEDLLINNRSVEQGYYLRNVNHLRIRRDSHIEFGIEAKHVSGNYENRYAEYTDALGQPVPALLLNEEIVTNKLAAFLSYNFQPIENLTTDLGLRADYYSYSENIYISPRISFSYSLNNKISLNLAGGIFYQNLPLLLLASNPQNRYLKDPMAIHYIAGVTHLLTDNTKFTLEVYHKNYKCFPLDQNQPGLFLIDEIYYRDASSFSKNQIIDTGKAWSRGIEIMIQKKLAQDFYGLISAAYFRTRYQGADNFWRDRIFDNRFIFSAEGGYKPNHKWEFSLRWIYAGGRPYTPFDLESSQAINRGVIDETKINRERYPEYHSLNIRLDRRFNFRRTNLVTYFSIWNVYNRKNVANNYWNQIDNKPDVVYQWSLLPIFGIEYEF